MDLLVCSGLSQDTLQSGRKVYIVAWANLCQRLLFNQNQTCNFNFCERAAEAPLTKRRLRCSRLTALWSSQCMIKALHWSKPNFILHHSSTIQSYLNIEQTGVSLIYETCRAWTSASLWINSQKLVETLMTLMHLSSADYGQQMKQNQQLSMRSRAGKLVIAAQSRLPCWERGDSRRWIASE